MQFNFRQAEIADLNGIVEIYKAAQAFMEANGNPQWPKGFPDENDAKCGIYGGVLYVVTTKSGEIAAVFSVLNYDRDYDEIEGRWLTEGAYLALHRVATAEKFRGKGAAKYVLNFAAMEIAKKRGRLSLRMDTHEKNIPMRKLLKSQGFTECGKIRLIRDDTLRLAFEKII